MNQEVTNIPETTRKLAHIEKIEAIIPIDGADMIVQYQVLGWKVISKKGEFKVGDPVLFLEVDSWVPSALAPFLTKPGKFPKSYNGVEGERLRTIKLRGALSQGLILPNIILADYVSLTDYDYSDIGTDVTADLGITKWEPEPEKIPHNAMGSFPYFIPKTDQPRIQGEMRSVEYFLQKNPGVTFTEEEKAEGSSTTIFVKDGEFGVCSRNLRLKIDDEELFQTSQWTKPAHKIGLREKLMERGQNIALQMELIGPQIQGNIYGLIDWEYRLFDVYDIDKQEYFSPEAVRSIAAELGIETTPILNTNLDITGMEVDHFVARSNGPSQIGHTKHIREGVVYKANTGGRFTFKAIDPEYLLLRGY